MTTLNKHYTTNNTNKVTMKKDIKNTLIAFLLVLTTALGGVFMYRNQGTDTTQTEQAVTYTTEVATTDTSSSVSAETDSSQTSTSAQTQTRQSRAS